MRAVSLLRRPLGSLSRSQATRLFGNQVPYNPAAKVQGDSIVSKQLFLLMGVGIGLAYSSYLNSEWPGYRRRLHKKANFKGDRSNSDAQVEYARILLDEVRDTRQDGSTQLKWTEIRSRRREAYKYLTLAAEQGNVHAHYWLGRMHFDGELEVSSMKAAVHHFEVASEVSPAFAKAEKEMSKQQRLELKRLRSDASFYFALCLLNGFGVDRPLILKGMQVLHSLVIKEGNPTAAMKLSEIYQTGQFNQDLNLKKSRSYLKEAAQLGSEPARQQLNDYYIEIGKTMTNTKDSAYEIPSLSAWPSKPQ